LKTTKGRLQERTHRDDSAIKVTSDGYYSTNEEQH